MLGDGDRLAEEASARGLEGGGMVGGEVGDLGWAAAVVAEPGAIEEPAEGRGCVRPRLVDGEVGAEV